MHILILLIQFIFSNSMTFGIGTLLIVISPIIKQHSVRMANFSKYIGVLIIVITVLSIILNIGINIAATR